MSSIKITDIINLHQLKNHMVIFSECAELHTYFYAEVINITKDSVVIEIGGTMNAEIMFNVISKVHKSTENTYGLICMSNYKEFCIHAVGRGITLYSADEPEYNDVSN